MKPSNFKKFVSMSTLAVAISQVAVPAQSAHALVGFLSWNPVLMGMGLAATTGALVLAEGGAGLVRAVAGEPTYMEYGVAYTFAGVGALGMIVLDGEGMQTLAFQEISSADAKRLGVNEIERLSFNSELDQVNLLTAEIQVRLNEQTSPTAAMAKDLWEGTRDCLRPDTFSAMQKIAAQWVAKR